MDYVIYDGNCNLCVNLVKLLETLDRGDRFQYIPMQDVEALSRFNITAIDCELGMILLNADAPKQRWHGSDAAEEIGRRLPLGNLFVEAYRALPGMKWTGDRLYAQVRDNRYTLFGKRSRTYRSPYPVCTDCGSSNRSAANEDIPEGEPQS
jgi:predicted DCC family thiol-disulfide oxidoreductase YuxK